MKCALSFSCIATVALSAASLLAQDASRYSVKGYRLGMSVADVQALQAPFIDFQGSSPLEYIA